jgi:hypothetical protein
VHYEDTQFVHVSKLRQPSDAFIPKLSSLDSPTRGLTLDRNDLSCSRQDINSFPAQDKKKEKKEKAKGGESKPAEASKDSEPRVDQLDIRYGSHASSVTSLAFHVLMQGAVCAGAAGGICIAATSPPM